MDISVPSGIASFVHCDGSSGRKYFVEQVGSGCVVFDYDNDGWPDLFFPNGAPLPGCRGPATPCALFHNNHDGTFTDVTRRAGVSGEGRYCTGAVAADYDNDGYLDLYVCCYGRNILYHNNGNGTFTDVTGRAGVGDPRMSVSACWFDYDRDGFLDLYVADYVNYDPLHDHWCGRTPGHKSYCGPTTYSPAGGRLYHNNGNGTFTDVTDRSVVGKVVSDSLGVIALDYDGDGWQDLFVADDQRPNILWHNNHNGTFTNTALETGVAVGARGAAIAGMGVDVGDPRNRGEQDILVSDFTEESEALFQQEQGYFRDVSDEAGLGATKLTLGFGTGFLDYDNDGWQDIFVANGHVMDDIANYSDVVTWAEPNQLFRNRGSGTFEDVSTRVLGPTRRVSRGAAFGDLFNTGRTDIVISTLRGHPVLLRNDWAPANHWLTLQLRASWGNPQAVGATATLIAGGLTRRRDVRAGSSYGSCSDLRPHFGLGKITHVDSVTIRWPSGRVSVLHNPPIDRILTVCEAKAHGHAAPITTAAGPNDPASGKATRSRETA